MKYAGAELVEDPSFMMKVVMECSRTYKYAGIKAYEFSPLSLCTQPRKHVRRHARARMTQAIARALADTRSALQSTRRPISAKTRQL